MNKAERFLAVLLFGIALLDSIAFLALAFVASFRLALALLVLACLFCVTGGVALGYGYVRRHNLEQAGQLASEAQQSDKGRSRSSPPSHFLMLGWGMLFAALVLLGLSIFWWH